MFEMLEPSGDTTGACDSAAIEASLKRFNAVSFAPGRFHTNRTITSNRNGTVIRGVGACSVVESNNPTVPVISLSKSTYTTVADLWTIGGMNAVDLDGACRCTISNVTMARMASHGIILRNGVWITNIRDCYLANVGGNGIHVDGGTAGDGNAICLSGVNVEGSTGYGIQWSGTGLSMTGCCIEGCKSPAILFNGRDHFAAGAVIHGCYFENNARAHIEFDSVRGKACHGISIEGSFFLNYDDAPCILFTGDPEETRRVVVDRTNFFSGTKNTAFIDAGNKAQRCEFHVKSLAKLNCTNQSINTITSDGS